MRSPWEYRASVIILGRMIWRWEQFDSSDADTSDKSISPNVSRIYGKKAGLDGIKFPFN